MFAVEFFEHRTSSQGRTEADGEHQEKNDGPNQQDCGEVGVDAAANPTALLRSVRAWSRGELKAAAGSYHDSQVIEGVHHVAKMKCLLQLLGN